MMWRANYPIRKNIRKISSLRLEAINGRW